MKLTHIHHRHDLVNKRSANALLSSQIAMMQAEQRLFAHATGYGEA